MAKIRCDGCGGEFDVDETKCINEEWMMCHICGDLSRNPFYEGGEKKADYLT
jgi:hypothetical protein